MRSSFLLFSLLVITSPAVMAISTQLIERGPLVDFASHEIMALDDAVLYLKKEGESEVVWSYSRKTATKKSLFKAVSGEVEWVGKTNGMAVFTQDSGCCEKLWRTDGTQAGTQPISAAEQPFQASSQGPWLIGSYADDQVFRTNGYQAASFSVEAPFLETTCAFDNGDFIFITATASESNLMRVTGDVISDINNQFTAGDDAAFFYNLNSQNNLCFINQFIQPSNSILYAVNQAGVVLPIDIQNNSYELIHDILHDPNSGSYYVSLGNGYDNDFRSAVFQINIETGHVLNTFEVTDRRFALYDMMLLQDMLAIRFGTPNESPEIPKIQFLDKDLALKTDTPFEEIISFISKPWRGKELLLFLPWYYDETGTFYTVDGGVISAGNDFAGFRVYDFEVADNEQHAYLAGRVSNSSEFVIHQVIADPDIGRSTGGMWFDDSRQNQGISINHGVRGDLSEYLFITVYTYDDGQPLWFAGMLEIEPNMQSASIPLYRFDGLNMWQQNLFAEQTQVGTLQFKHSGCDLLDVVFEVNGNTQPFQVRRMDNIVFQSECQQ